MADNYYNTATGQWERFVDPLHACPRCGQVVVAVRGEDCTACKAESARRSQQATADRRQAEYEAIVSYLSPDGYEVVEIGNKLDGQPCPPEGKVERFADGRWFAHLPYRVYGTDGVFVAPRQIAAQTRKKVLREMYG